MNSQYWISYANTLERVLAVGHSYHYFSGAVERAISYSSFFQAVEKDKDGFPPTIDDDSLIKQVFPELLIDFSKINEYVETSWAAYAYANIQCEFQLSFECIFLFIPIEKMFAYFPLYHEMDFSRIVEEFKRLKEQKSALLLLIEKYGLTIKDVSKKTGIPYATLLSLCKRKRDIQKLNVKDATILASFFRVRVETLCELKMN